MVYAVDSGNVATQSNIYIMKVQVQPAGTIGPFSTHKTVISQADRHAQTISREAKNRLLGDEDEMLSRLLAWNLVKNAPATAIYHKTRYRSNQPLNGASGGSWAQHTLRPICDPFHASRHYSTTFRQKTVIQSLMTAYYWRTYRENENVLLTRSSACDIFYRQ